MVCQKGDVQGAIDSLIDCSRRFPEDAASQWNVGVLLARVNDYENALSWMEEALRLNPTSLSYLRGIGTTALKAGERKWEERGTRPLEGEAVPQAETDRWIAEKRDRCSNHLLPNSCRQRTKGDSSLSASAGDSSPHRPGHVGENAVSGLCTSRL